jgi:peptide/nickel transport system permease protein
MHKERGVREAGWLERRLGTEVYQVVKRLVTKPLSLIGIVLLGMFVFVALAAPILAPMPPNRSHLIPNDGFSRTPRPPGTMWERRPPPLPFWWRTVVGTDQWIHLMGTTSGQGDIYYGVIWGTRTALQVGIIITLVTVLIGITVGSVAAYYGGVLDIVLMRVAEIFMIFPALMAALTLAVILTPIIGRGMLPSMLALMVFGWPVYAQLVRSDILSVRGREYVLAAKMCGARDLRVMFRHILPNAIFPTMVLASMEIGSLVIVFSTLSFLGIGTEEGYPDWGQLLSFARHWIPMLREYWYIVVYPAVALILFVLAWNLVGDGLRDVLDPKLQGSR